MNRPLFRTFEPKIAGLEEALLKYRDITLKHDFGCAEDEPGHDGRSVMRHLGPPSYRPQRRLNG